MSAGNIPEEQQGVWILCRAKLPAYERRVLVSYRGEHKNSTHHVRIAIRHSTDKSGEHWKTDEWTDLVLGSVVTAWMPVPEGCSEE